MMMLQTLLICLFQSLLFMLGIGTAGLAAHLGGPMIAAALGINELIPSAGIFFGVIAALGWIANRLWPG